MNDNTEYQLVKALKKGDLHAFDQLFIKYSKKLYYFAYSHLSSREEAEELVQEVFLKIWENRRGLKEDLSFNAYLFTVSLNAIRKHFRKELREKKYMNRFIENSEKNYNGTICNARAVRKRGVYLS